MFRQLKEIFRKEEELPLILTPGEVSGWLEREQSLVSRHEKEHVDISRKKILGNIEHLRELIRLLGSVGHDGVVHPKLEKVVEKSLPVYKKAIITALNRDFPESPGEFYFAATECLKGCLKSSAGPGRYLVAVFPEEMKEIRAVIDLVGREINSMNPVIAEARNKTIELVKIRHLHDSYVNSCKEFQQAENQYPLVISRLKDLNGEIKVIDEEITRLSHDPRRKQLEQLLSDEQQLLTEKEKLFGELSSLSHLIVHVFRRAEKIAEKDRDLHLAKKAHSLAELLSKSDVPRMSVIIQDLNEILPEIIQMVNQGRISVKNKEEDHYFSNPDILPVKIQEILQKIERNSTLLKENRIKIDGSIYMHDKDALDTRYRQKKNELAEAEQNRVALDGRITGFKAGSPPLLQQLEDCISGYSGKKTTIRLDPDTP